MSVSYAFDVELGILSLEFCRERLEDFNPTKDALGILQRHLSQAPPRARACRSRSRLSRVRDTLHQNSFSSQLPAYTQDCPVSRSPPRDLTDLDSDLNSFGALAFLSDRF